MKIKTISQSLITGIVTSSLVLGLAIIPAFAETVDVGASTNVTVKTTGIKANATVKATANTRLISQGDREISNRIDSLNKVSARLQEMKKISATVKTALTTQVQTEISALTTLKAKIDADTDTATLKADVKSITAPIRIYALVIPQVRIAAVSDRALTIADLMVTISGKLSTNISSAATAGKNVTTLQTVLTDLNAKVADSKVQASAAENLVISLTPDNGDATKAASNKAAIKSAQADIKIADQDLRTARKDIETITKGLKALNVKTSVTAGSATTVTQ